MIQQGAKRASMAGALQIGQIRPSQEREVEAIEDTMGVKIQRRSTLKPFAWQRHLLGKEICLAKTLKHTHIKFYFHFIQAKKKLCLFKKPNHKIKLPFQKMS